jgi:hypothetical protein
MKYFLQNIAQSSPMRTIILVLIGLVFWIFSLIQQAEIFAILTTMVLTGINGILLAYIFLKVNLTNLPSLFAASSYWAAISTIPQLHSCWQIQLMMFGILTIILILSDIKYQREVTEEAFLATLICCFLAPIRIAMITGIVILWIYLIVRGWMTWRALVASLIAILLRVIMMILLHHFGWMDWMWMENIPTLPWQKWAIANGIFVGFLLATLLPIRRPSVVSGGIYVIFLSTLFTIGILFFF